MAQYHLAEINLARLVAPLDDPRLADFVAGLDHINQLGEQSPGFVWRLKDDTGDATAIQWNADPKIIINMTVWESIDALFEFTYKSDHVGFFRRRKEWFEAPNEVLFVMWWVPAGYIPTLEDAKERLTHLQMHGATPYAFNFKQRFTVEEFLAWEQPQTA